MTGTSKAAWVREGPTAQHWRGQGADTASQPEAGRGERLTLPLLDKEGSLGLRQGEEDREALWVPGVLPENC